MINEAPNAALDSNSTHIKLFTATYLKICLTYLDRRLGLGQLRRGSLLVERFPRKQSMAFNNFHIRLLAKL